MGFLTAMVANRIVAFPLLGFGSLWPLNRHDKIAASSLIGV